ncbi:MAG: LysE family translocator [Desulfobacteraceae bacterium]|nr:LysE family translocator [Desulfobacteraceae bacterium]
MEFLIIASTHFLALLSPGPDFFLILQTALRLPLRYAFAVCAGIASANAVYLAIAVAGLEAVKEMTLLMLVLKYLGGAYLVYIGVLLVKAPKRALDGTGAGRTGFLHARSMKQQFAIGFMSGILNPKNAVFYLSLFTVMVSPATGIGLRILYACWMTGIVLFWDMGVAVMMGNPAVKQRLGRWIFGIEKVSGAVLTLFGILLTIR